jgi:hypothetical protein
VNWTKISGLALVATIGMYAPATAHAQAGSDASHSAKDSLLTAEQLAHYMAVKRALGS